MIEWTIRFSSKPTAQLCPGLEVYGGPGGHGLATCLVLGANLRASHIFKDFINGSAINKDDLALSKMNFHARNPYCKLYVIFKHCKNYDRINSDDIC